uniref:Uncharacterized protein n=1 Tax=Panagrellus redivivus TaxID=6233 RepID=A0A7E4VWL0_PANRE
MRLPEPAWPCITPRLNPTRVLGAELVLRRAAVGVTILVIDLYGAIAIFDVTTRSSVPFIPTIHIDPREFSCNELRFYNTKSMIVSVDSIVRQRPIMQVESQRKNQRQEQSMKKALEIDVTERNSAQNMADQQKVPQNDKKIFKRKEQGKERASPMDRKSRSEKQRSFAITERIERQFENKKKEVCA